MIEFGSMTLQYQGQNYRANPGQIVQGTYPISGLFFTNRGRYPLPTEGEKIASFWPIRGKMKNNKERIKSLTIDL